MEVITETAKSSSSQLELFAFMSIGTRLNYYYLLCCASIFISTVTASALVAMS